MVGLVPTGLGTPFAPVVTWSPSRDIGILDIMNVPSRVTGWDMKEVLMNLSRMAPQFCFKMEGKGASPTLFPDFHCPSLVFKAFTLSHGKGLRPQMDAFSPLWQE